MVKSSNNISEIAKKLKLSTGHGNRQTIIRYIKRYNIDTSHFNIIYKNNNKNFNKIDINNILIKNSKYVSTVHLKNRLYKEGLKERKCELCGQDENWNGKKMSLILDHINGINDDNRIENIRIVCPNCNATLDTHCGKNFNNNYIKIKLNNGLFKSKSKKLDNFCKCGIKLNKLSKMCNTCFSIHQRKTKRPPYEQLLKEIEELGYCGTGRKYGVSDNAIRKWKKYYNKHNVNNA